jgi:hypothetical protein
MAWNPTLQVFDPRFIAPNLLAWFKANQADALLWANNGTALPPIKDFFENEHTPTRFPVLMINRVQYQTETGEDIAETQIALQFEIILVHGNQDWLALNAPRYSMAFESMTKNIPKSSLETNSKIEFDGVLLQIETNFDFLKTNGSQFIQSFKTSVNWLCGFSNE